MVQSVFRIFTTAVCFLVLFSFSACNNATTKEIKELNTPYNGSVLKITATEIKAIPKPSESDRIIIGVRFIVENISNEDFYLSGKIMSTYVDDVTTDETGSAYFDKPGESFGGHIASGKRTEGYRCVDVSKDAKFVEFYFRETYSPTKTAVFIFEVPSVEQDQNSSIGDSTTGDSTTVGSSTAGSTTGNNPTVGSTTRNSTTRNSTTTSITTTSSTADDSEKITLAQFEQVKNGMTYEEVSAIIGKGTKLAETGTPGDSLYTVSYSYKGKGAIGANAIVLFQGNKLITKSQAGLK